MSRWSGLALLIVAAACGRTQPGRRADAAAPSPEPPTDATSAVSDAAWVMPLDTALPIDPPPDSPPPDLALPSDPSPIETDLPISCRDLQPLADLPVLTSQRTRQVLFAPDRSWMVLRMQQTGDPGIGYPDRLVRIELPSGKSTTLSDSGGTVEALGTRGALLLSGMGRDGGDSNDRAVYDSSGLRTIATGVCSHKATPDGSRIYILRDCGQNALGTLDVVEVETGKTTPVATHVYRSTTTTSPDSNWAAFVIGDADGGWQSDTIHLVHKSGQTYALASQPGSGGQEFIFNDLLLFDTGSGTSSPSSRGDIRGHVPGSGDTSYLVASGRGTGNFGYKVSADGAWLLGAALPAPRDGGGLGGELYAIRIDGSSQHLLASDLLAFWLYQMAVDAFAWSGDGSRAIYLAEKSHAVWASDALGTSYTRLSDQGSFVAARSGDRVILLESVAGGRQDRLRVVALNSGANVAVFDSDGRIDYTIFLPDGRGLLFANVPASGLVELRFLSFTGGDTKVLGNWNQTLLSIYSTPYGGPEGGFPIDPTGCFTLVDTDLTPGPGTRLVLLP